jgi:pSer/pThr/pTyr-binding forkhead associated (FHA) protein
MARRIVLLGRAEWCDVRVESDSASREHAELRLTDEGLELADLGSLNGTMLNGEVISAPEQLRPGDVIGIGSELVVVERASASVVSDPRGLMARSGERPEAPTRTHRDQIELLELLAQNAQQSPQRAQQAVALCRAIDNLAAYFSRSHRRRAHTYAARLRLTQLAGNVRAWFPDGQLDHWHAQLVRALDPPAESPPLQ